MVSLKDKVALVTGGGSGIGRAICLEFARQGALVAIADINARNGRAVSEEIRQFGQCARDVEVDVTKSDEVSHLVKEIIDEFGRVDVLVNNAGYRLKKHFLEHSEEEWRSMLDLNLTAHFLCSKAVVPHMLRQGKGKIINMISVASYVGRPHRVAYCAAKGGLLSFTRALAADLANTNICVNAIAPGLIESPSHAVQGELPTIGPGLLWGKETLLGRWGQPEDVATAAVFLASDDSNFITGTDLKVDGGWLAARSRAGEV